VRAGLNRCADDAGTVAELGMGAQQDGPEDTRSVQRRLHLSAIVHYSDRELLPRRR
jgi:hypothetical protein